MWVNLIKLNEFETDGRVFKLAKKLYPFPAEPEFLVKFLFGYVTWREIQKFETIIIKKISFFDLELLNQ